MKSRFILHLTATIAALVAFNLSASAGITLPALVGDSMVLQQNTTVKLWGSTDSGKTLKITTSWNGKSFKAVPDSLGNWSVEVPTSEAGGPYCIDIKQGKDAVKISDVMLGEVWLCSGQSNMQMPVIGYSSQGINGGFEAILEAPSHPDVRVFFNPVVAREGYQEELHGKWMRSSMTSVAPFSAIGYFFALRIHEILGVPVGIVQSAYGGTKIQSWMSVEAAQSVDPNVLDRDVTDTDDLNRKLDNTAFLYKSMIWPFRNYNFKGFLWYQGESNKGEHKTYAQNMAAMVKCWRELFYGNDLKPFYYVMLTPFNYQNPFDKCDSVKGDLTLPLMWESLVRALDLIPASGMAVTTDLGDPDYIHPPQKHEIADRLAIIALHDCYGDKGEGAQGYKVSWMGPIFKSADFNKQEGKVIVEFDSPSTLCPAIPFEKNIIEGFEVAGEDKVFHKADAMLYQPQAYGFTTQVVVSCPEVAHPVAVRYCFHDIPKGNLTNTLGLPAFPFRSDDWDDVTGVE